MPLKIVEKLKKHTTERNIIIINILLTLIVFSISIIGIINEVEENRRLVEFGIMNKLEVVNVPESLGYDNYEHISPNELKVLHTSSIKTYMDYKAITNKSSNQWDMIYEQKLFKITVDGYLITDDGYYAVALGSYFGNLGSKYIMVLDTGIEIPVCKLDAKADVHTDSNNYAAKNNGGIIEFIIDGSKMQYAMTNNGYIYNGNFNNCDLFKGDVVKIIIVDKK